MLDYLILFLTFVIIVVIGLYLEKKQEKLLREGTFLMATIDYIRPINSDDAGNTTVTYILDIEGHKLKGTRKIDTFYSPLMQQGMKIELLYKDDKDYLFAFEVR